MKSTTRLPSDEIDFIRSQPHHTQQARLSVLHHAGWTLSALARSLDVPKTTIHFWIRSATPDPAMQRHPIPAPPLPITSVLPTRYAPRIRSISPKVPPDLRPKLRQLSEMSRRCRAKTPPNSPIALANRELTALAINLRAKGVPTADIADAAGVSYRAMARRIAQGAPRD